MTWFYNDKEFTSEDIQDYVGFVYLIKRLSDGKSYIGKKLFRSKRMAQKNGRKRAVYKESDWLTYWGSNTQLVSDVEKEGPEGFQRVILHLCNSKGSMSYLEITEQIKANALLREDYYNSFIGCKIHAKHVK